MAEVGDAYTELQKMGYFSPAPPLLRICPESGLRLWVPRFQIKVRQKRYKRGKSPSHVPACRSSLDHGRFAPKFRQVAFDKQNVLAYA
jgi:uncharacterized protein YbbK (DUF523 family)